MNKFKSALICVFLIGSAASCFSFTMLGTPAGWQTTRIGYQTIWNGVTDLGAPMNLGNEYRITQKIITYGYTPEFVNWYGQRGMDEIDEAVTMLEDLGDLSVIDPNAFPLQASRFHASAFQLELVDLKSSVLQKLVELAGLGNPERFVFCLRNLEGTAPNIVYSVIQRNFDPITYKPSSYINGHLYTYVNIFDDTTIAYPIIVTVDPLAEQASPVAAESSRANLAGTYYANLTRDDVGGLKYIYSNSNWNVQTLPTGSASSSGGLGVIAQNGSSNAWSPVLPNLTNTVATISTNLVNQGLRPGIGKLDFEKVEYDQTFGEFIPVSVRESDLVITNGFQTRQIIERALDDAPDLTFSAQDLLTLYDRSAISYTNFDAISAVAGDSGPGSVNFPYTMSFSSEASLLINAFPFNQDEEDAVRSPIYGSFDGSTSEPFVYPDTESLERIQSALSSSSGEGISWVPVPALNLTDPNNQDPNAVGAVN